MSVHSEQIRIRGQVQGVGFRPTVWQTAHELSICGTVCNDGSGVVIIAQSSPERIEQMLAQLQNNQPPLARIESIERQTIEPDKHYCAFSIEPSVSDAIHTGIIADAATCQQCLAEVNDKNNRRHNYAFTNCTHCGPRLSIVSDIPYDRANTSMAEFKLCSSCQQEYENPADRRFHAQPNACADCGPEIWLMDNSGIHIDSEPLSTTARLLKQGYIVAIKGIGGFQLACDASNNAAVKTLRSRKQRPHKALALMAKSTSQVEQYCRLNTSERELLQSPACPVVLLYSKKDSRLATDIAPAQQSLGFMLPYTALHHILMQQLEFPIVLTSGNHSEAPQCTDNSIALSELGAVADYFLLNNRDIVNRIDDSVLTMIDSKPHVLRRARGFAPSTIPLPGNLVAPGNILACGGELKNTFALLRDNQVTLSQHIGNLENAQTSRDYLNNINLYKKLYQFDPNYTVVDMHPDYVSSQYGRNLAVGLDIPCIEVQHHHAHIAACMVENAWPVEQGPVLGITLDGLGFGDDGTIWGGEFMLADYTGFERVARLRPAAMPGGNQSTLQPWRNTYAQLHSCFDWNHIADRYANLEIINFLSEKPLTHLRQMISSRLNTPMTSSCGRLFDGVAAALDICRASISYEGQAAIELENLIEQDKLLSQSPYQFELTVGQILEINPGPMWAELLDDLSTGTSIAVISARFHLGLANIIIETALKISTQSGVNTVALSGGVFQNRVLFKLCLDQLQQNRLTVLFHQQVPTNDGGLALGQAAIAAAQIGQRSQQRLSSNA
ncbi:MAG: carbamoyltransferase HypF [Gammaproteobacteria bacterium]|nr:carbamoyltransferase HypF [Gammaproteobacteria bacterium]